MNQRLRWFFLLLVAAVCAACSERGEQVAMDAGPFRILREQNSYGSWSTGGTTTYYSYDVRYRKHEIHFPEFSYHGGGKASDTEITSSQIGYAAIVSQSPPALLVVAGDLNNDASWYLLVDTPSGLRSEHVAFYGSYDELAWLDGDVPVPIKDRRKQLKLEDGRWLWVNSESILDRDSLHVYRLPSYGGSKGGALFVAFSPDRRKMARYESITDPNSPDGWRSVIIENDIASGQIRSFDIDERTMWFDASEDIDHAWLTSYFEWRKEGDEFTLRPLVEPKPRPYHGRQLVESSTNGLQYRVPRLRYEHRQAAMDFIAAALGRTYSLAQLELDAQEPTVAKVANSEAGPRTDAATPAPFFGKLAAVDLDIEGKQLTVYFSEDGLSIENNDSALNEVVQKIAAKLDAEFQTVRGMAWIVDKR